MTLFLLSTSWRNTFWNISGESHHSIKKLTQTNKTQTTHLWKVDVKCICCATAQPVPSASSEPRNPSLCPANSLKSSFCIAQYFWVQRGKMHCIKSPLINENPLFNTDSHGGLAGSREPVHFFLLAWKSKMVIFPTRNTFREPWI